MIDFKGAIFDLDGTLLDSMVIWDTVAIDYLKSQGIAAKEDIYEAVRSMSIQQVCGHFCSVYGLKLTHDEIIAGINGMVEDFYFYRAPLKPGALETLTLLKERGVALCLATATDRYLVEAALKRHGILAYFSHILTCTEVGSGKDEPEIFLRALDFLGTGLQDTVVFEDALYAIETAKTTGFRVVALYDKSAEQNQRRIKELADCFYTTLKEWIEDNA